MKRKLKDAQRLVTKVLNNSGLEPGQRDQLERAQRELTVVAKSGKMNRDRIYRVVRIITIVLSETIDRDKP